MTLGEFPTGARVVKTTAIFCDTAFENVGIVRRKGDMVGVEWEKRKRYIIQYPVDEPGFEPASD